MDFLKIPTCQRVWEPACGDGRMVDVLTKRGYAVSASDLHEYGRFPAGADFLLSKHHPADWIITNPPFHIIDEWICHCLDFDKPFALLLKSQFWHAKNKLSLFRRRPPMYVLPLTWRPDFLFGSKSSSPTMECIWTVWGVKGSVTEYFPLVKPDNRRGLF